MFLCRLRLPNVRFTSTTKLEAETENLNKPIVYSASPASKWQAKHSRMGTNAERLRYEPHIVLISLTVFMIYFCVLREESDIDKEFEQTLVNRITGLEEQQIRIALEYNEKHGLEIKQLNDRLEEIESSKRK